MACRCPEDAHESLVIMFCMCICVYVHICEHEIEEPGKTLDETIDWLVI